jgi:hypothetical protein
MELSEAGQLDVAAHVKYMYLQRVVWRGFEAFFYFIGEFFATTMHSMAPIITAASFLKISGVLSTPGQFACTGIYSNTLP